MSFIHRQQQSDDQKIQDIITAFETYALGDIEHNIKTEKPVAAFLLSSCWIDQVALFVYNHNEENLDQHYKNFIKTYLPKYTELDLYTNLRCKLVHSYSVGVNMRMATDDKVSTDSMKSTHANFITAKTLLKDLKEAWNVVKTELLTVGTKPRENALKRFDISPTLIQVGEKTFFYEKHEADFLINYYKPLLKGKSLNGKKNLIITALIKELVRPEANQYVIFVVIKKNKTKSYREYLERATQQFNLPFPDKILEKLN